MPSFSELREGIAASVQELRQSPVAFAAKLQEMATHVDGLLLTRAGQVPVALREGRAAVDEAIEWLLQQEPHEALTFSQALSTCA